MRLDISFLAHLSRGLSGELIGYLCRPYVCICMSTFSNISSETTGPIKIKFYMEPPWDRGTKVCSTGPGHMTKMAAANIW